MFFVLFLILRFARSSTYHYAHTIDTCGYLCNRYFGFVCSIVEKLPQEGSKMDGLYKIYINNNKTYSYKAGLISSPWLQEHTKLVLRNHL